MKTRPMALVLALAVLSLSAFGSTSQAAIDEKLEHFFTLVSSGANATALRMVAEPGFLTSVDKDGHTALFVAAVAGNAVVLDEILKRPYDLSHRDNSGSTVVWFVATTTHHLILERLLALAARGKTAFRGAAAAPYAPFHQPAMAG